MKILLTGATGFIGGHILQALINAGHAVTACVHRPQSIILPKVHVVKVDFEQDCHVSYWLPRVQGIDIVINCVGIIRETRHQSFDALQRATPIALFQACTKANVKKVIQLSALGADDTAFSRYHLSKKAADDFLAPLAIDWLILQPSIVYGPDAKSMDFFKALAALPFMPVVDGGHQQIQPVHINDLVKAIMRSLEPDAPMRLYLPVVGPQALSFRELLSQLNAWLGLPPPHFWSMPFSSARIIGPLLGALENWPITSETLKMLRSGNVSDVTPFATYIGTQPQSLEETLQATPAQSADFQQARLYFLLPALRWALALLWIMTGFVSAFLYPSMASYALLEKIAITGIMAPIALYGAAVLDFSLGIALLMRYQLKRVATVQMMLMVLYSILITFGLPELWAHPFGPVTKNIPLVVATLILIAVERDH